MNSLKNKLILFLAFAAISLQAQDNLSYGIKAGLGVSTILGDKEMNAQGEDLEKTGYVAGFHIGVVFNIDIVEDKFGVAPEFLFVQKGGRYQYDGPGSLTLNAANGSEVTFQGQKDDAFSVVNSYIDIPVMLYYKPIERIKISLGMDVGFLVASTGSGESRFIRTNGVGEEEVATVNLDYNFIRDKPGEAKSETMQTVTLGGTPLEYPESIGAYYFNETDEGNYYKTIDMGLCADLTLFITKGISLGFRANYGLLDITNDKLDFSRQNSGELRLDKDRNLSFSTSLAFNF